MTNIIEKAQRSVRNWWISVAVGILSIALGIYCFTIPFETFMGLSIVFEVFFFAGAILEIFFAISNSMFLRGWGWMLAGGIVDLLLAILLITAPQPAVAEILVYLVAFWIMFRAIWGVGAACELQGWGIRGWGWMLVLAIALIVLSFWFIYNPIIGATAIVWVFALTVILYGCFRIFVGLSLNKVRVGVNDFKKSITAEEQ